MNVNLTPQARDDLVAIKEWIEADDPRAAERVVSRILQTIEMFGHFPMLGYEGREPGTREFSVVGLPYIIVYAIASETELNVLTVIHARRQYPPVS